MNFRGYKYINGLPEVCFSPMIMNCCVLPQFMYESHHGDYYTCSWWNLYVCVSECSIYHVRAYFFDRMTLVNECAYGKLRAYFCVWRW